MSLFPRLAATSRFLVPFLHHDEAEIARTLQQGGTTLAGWSTGSHIICKHLPEVLHRFDRIVLVAPFLAFPRYMPRSRVDAMITAMGRDPDRTVESFLKRCGHGGPVSSASADAPSLVKGLRFLLQSTAELPQGLSCGNLTLVHGERDRIVPVQASLDIMSALPGARLVRVMSGHLVDETILLHYLHEA